MSEFDAIFDEARGLLNHDGPPMWLKHINLFDFLKLHAQSPGVPEKVVPALNKELAEILTCIQKQDFEFGLTMKDGKISLGYRFKKKTTPKQRAMMIAFIVQIIVHGSVTDEDCQEFTETASDQTACNIHRAQEKFVQLIGKTVGVRRELVSVACQNKL